MNDIKAILFDLGGVLVELSGVSTMLRWSALGLDEESLWRLWLTSPAVRVFETGLISAEDFADQIIDELKLNASRDQFLEAFAAWPSGLYPGAPEVLNQLRQHYTLACLSNTSELHWPRMMEEMALEDHLDHHFASHIMGKIKPDLECFEHVLDELGLDAKQVLFFDDNAINIEGSREIGVHGILVKGIDDVVRYLDEVELIRPNN